MQNAAVVADVVVARFTGRLAVVACRRVVIGHTTDDRLHGAVVNAGGVAILTVRATLPVVIVVRAGAIGAVLAGEGRWLGSGSRGWRGGTS